MEASGFDFWMFLAGLGIFLFGMFHLELGLNGLAGRSFRGLLQRFTKKTWKGILTGVVVTAILQSSTLVNLLLAAFLGGGMMALSNSLGVMMGANLGTTLTAWMVATLGFKLNIADLSFPFLAIGTLTYIVMEGRPVLKNIGSFLIGFGLLFLGLDFMKDTIEEVTGQLTLSTFNNLGLWVFLLIGLVITALIQSSSAMIVIVLSALHGDFITLYQAVAMVIGANIGTTSTVVLASLKGTADKKRLALANVIFNGVSGVLVFVFLRQFVDLSMRCFDIGDPLMELVLLNTGINLIGILIFYPLLGPFERFIQARFVSTEPTGLCRYIVHVDTSVPEVALTALGKELKHVYALTHDFILDCLKMRGEDPPSGNWRRIFQPEINLLDAYNRLKTMEDEITYFYTRIQESRLSEEEAARTSSYMMDLRSMLYAAKHVKDIIPNIQQIDESDDKLSKDILVHLQQFTGEQLARLEQHVRSGEPIVGLAAWHESYEQYYQSMIEHLYRDLPGRDQHGVPVSTVTNVIKKTISALEELANAQSAEK